MDVVVTTSTGGSIKVEYDLVILDLYMPNKSGLDLCRQIKRNSNTKDIPVVMLSGSYDIADKEACYEAGAIDYLEKPVGRSTLINTINTYANLGVMAKAVKRIQRGIEADANEKEDRRDSVSDN